MMRILALISFLASISGAIAQPLEFSAIVLDDKSGSPIAACHIITSPDIGSFTSDEAGAFLFQIDGDKNQKVQFTLEHISYEKKEVELDLSSALLKDNKGPLKFEMNRVSYELEAVDILSERLPELVYSSTQHSIADYEFLDERVLLLAYEKRLEKASKLLLMDADMRCIDSLILPSSVRATRLYRDYSERVFLETKNKVFAVESSGEGLRIFPVDMEVYQEQIVPVVDRIGDRYYFSTWIDRFPAFDYYAYNSEAEDYEHIKQIVDQEMLTMCRAEYKYLTTRDKLKMFRLELETGFEKEVLTCMGVFEDGLYYDEVYAPMFSWKDRLYLFDHPSDQLYVMDAMGAKLDSVPIDYHQRLKVMSNHFSEQVLKDEGTGEFYALFQKPGGKCQLQRVDILTGRVDHIKTLHYDYPSSIQVRNKEVFYTYRPFESLQKKYLYKEGIED